MSYNIRISLLLTIFALTFPTDAAGPRFSRVEREGVPVVVDHVTGLTWQGCPAGMNGDQGSCFGNTEAFAWSAAKAYCETTLNSDSDHNAGITDWYLPDIKELRGIVDNRTSNPATDEIFFPDTPDDQHFWSSSPYAPNTSRATYVNFDLGNVSNYGKSSLGYVRCVCRTP